MKYVITLILFFSVIAASGQEKAPKASPDSLSRQIVEASCGECNFGLKGKSCDLAVRINGKAYFVKGTDIDSHGDAHAKDGFCNAVRKAEVRGEIRDGFFYASFFKLLPEDKKPDNNNGNNN